MSLTIFGAPQFPGARSLTQTFSTVDWKNFSIIFIIKKNLIWNGQKQFDEFSRDYLIKAFTELDANEELRA